MDIIFDVDGTLMNNNHRKGFIENVPKPDWEAYNEAMAGDVPNKDICMIASTLGVVNHLLITTGREEKYRTLTHSQLAGAGVRYDLLLMRPNGDFGSDQELKKNMLIRLRREGYNPELAFDDRDRVVEMWRDMGLRCLQVAPGDF